MYWGSKFCFQCILFIVTYYHSVLPWFYFLGHLKCLTNYLFHLISALRSWLPFGKWRWSGRGFLPPKNYKSNLCLKAKCHYIFKDKEIFCIIKDLLDQSVGEWFYKDACQLDEQMCHFEANIHGSYFYVKPLYVSQLEN